MTHSRKKIALLGPSHPWRGGIAHYNACLFNALKNEGHIVKLWNFQALYPEFLFPGKSQVDASDSPIQMPDEVIYHPLLPHTWLQCAKKLVHEEIDTLVLQWWHPYFAPGYAAVATAARALGIDTVMICHNVEPHESTLADNLLLRLAYAAPSRFVVQSTVEADKLRAHIGNARRIDVVAHPPYDVFQDISARPSRDDAREKWSIKAKHAFLFFGLVRHYKGVDILLEAVAQLPSDLDWELLVVGEFYDPLEPYQKQVEALNLQSHVRLIDRYIANEEIAELFCAVDMCVLPYRHATGSGIANIARSFGLPVVMSDLAGLREGFEDYEKVCWCACSEVDSLRNGILEALHISSPKGLSSQGANAWSHLVNHVAS